MLGKFPVPVVLLIWIIVGQGHIMLATNKLIKCHKESVSFDHHNISNLGTKSSRHMASQRRIDVNVTL